MSAAMEALVRSAESQALACALLHSLWQGALAAVVVAVFRTPRARYGAGCVALAAMLCGLAFTFAVHLPHEGTAAAWSGEAVAVVRPETAGAEAIGMMTRAGAMLPWLTPFWMAGVLLFQLRAMAGWVEVRRLRRRGVCEAATQWSGRLTELAARMRVTRPVRLLESALATVPVVAGHFRPVILVPAGLLSSMPPEQVEWILLHELAHIRRHDYMVNVLQTMAEGLLFYHPAAWWISGVIRAEREHCCDDLAVGASETGGAYEYASALAALEESRWGGEDRETAVGIAATGGNLMGRVHRLLYPEGAQWSAAPLLFAALAVLVTWQMTAAQSPRENADPFLRWANEDVVHIIGVNEREAFIALKTNAERERFVEQFWQRRDPTPGTPANEFKEEHYRRIAYASGRFGRRGSEGWRTDRGRIYIVYGPPDEIESHPNGRAGGPPSEQWMYHYLEGIGKRVLVEFVDARRDGDYRQTMAPKKK